MPLVKYGLVKQKKELNYNKVDSKYYMTGWLVRNRIAGWLVRNRLLNCTGK